MMSENDQVRRSDIEDIKQTLREIQHSINGNGSPGILTRLRLLETWQTGVSRMVWIAVGAASVSVISGLITVLMRMP